MRKIILFVLLLTSCQSSNAVIQYTGEKSDLETNYQAPADTVPPGFINLDAAIEEIGGILSWLIWSNNIVIMDVEGVTIFQRSMDDDELFFFKQSQVFINEEKFSELVEMTREASERLNAIYAVGDTIIFNALLAGRRVLSEVIINSVERNVSNGSSTYTIKISINPGVRERNILQFFDYVQTSSGNRVEDFTVIESHSEDVQNPYSFVGASVQIEFSDNDTMEYLMLNIPSELSIGAFQNSMRRIRISEGN